ncbi:MAG: hypothetical protein ACKVON_16030 [Beijerinckiaceae bacterium]
MSQEEKPESYLAILQRLKILTSRGTVTESARGFWGGVAKDGRIVVTAWDDSRPAGQTYYEFKRPRRANGGLQAAWDDGRVGIGAEVHLILIEPLDRSIAYGKLGRKVKSARLMPELWRVSENSPEDGSDQPKKRVVSAKA